MERGKTLIASILIHRNEVKSTEWSLKFFPLPVSVVGKTG